MVGVAKKIAFWQTKELEKFFKFQFHEKILYQDDGI